MIKSSLAAGCAAAALLLAPGVASAQDAQAALEARIAQLEAELNALKSEVVAARTQQAAQQQDIIRLEARPAPPMGMEPGIWNSRRASPLAGSPPE